MASPRDRAASIATARLSLTLVCPMNSWSLCGRSFSSNEESSSTEAADTRRSGLSFRLGLCLALATRRMLPRTSGMGAGASRFLPHASQRPDSLPTQGLRSLKRRAHLRRSGPWPPQNEHGGVNDCDSDRDERRPTLRPPRDQERPGHIRRRFPLGRIFSARNSWTKFPSLATLPLPSHLPALSWPSQ